YAIDHPWLLRPKSTGGDRRRLEGRDLTLYYPSFRYQFCDLGGNIWWNDDPWSWHGAEDGFMNSSGLLGSVCLLLWRIFPDNSPTNATRLNSAGWKPIKMPDAAVLRQLGEDLNLRGEIIDVLWHSQRASDALECLAEFGTREQLPAITQLETDLPLRIER